MKKALIFRGGWDGHEPIAVSLKLGALLEEGGFAVDIFDGVDCLASLETLLTYDLIVPCVTMGEIPDAYVHHVSEAVAKGVGLAGCHGGMCDAFRSSTEWQFITGGQWVAHPGGDCVKYTVHISPGSNPIVEGIADFEICSEQYYLHVDPAIEVLATTKFPIAAGYHAVNKPIDMPVVWTKRWGNGRVFYCSLGHSASLFEVSSEAKLLMQRGMLWAGGSENEIKI